jgi:hypothetical protein
LLQEQRCCWENKLVVARTALLLGEQACCCRNSVVVGRTGLLLREQRCCWENKLVVARTALLLGEQACCCKNSVVVGRTSLLSREQHCCSENKLVVAGTVETVYDRPFTRMRGQKNLPKSRNFWQNNRWNLRAGSKDIRGSFRLTPFAAPLTAEGSLGSFENLGMDRGLRYRRPFV